MEETKEVTPAVTQQQPEQPGAEAQAQQVKSTYSKKQKKPKTTDGTTTTHHEHAKDPRKAQDDQVMGVCSMISTNPSYAHLFEHSLYLSLALLSQQPPLARFPN